MKISYKWLSQFIQTDKTPAELSLVLTDIGLEVESLEKVQSVPGGLEGLVVGYVKECIQHPNADRLRVTRVDVGGASDLQIVCGAPNVARGQKVVVATVGTTLYPLEGEPFKINRSKIRGEVSEGMICAEDEIGLGKSHEGIMLLETDIPVGMRVKDLFNNEDDYVFEIGLTPNRADAASHLGVARDLAAYFKTRVILPEVAGFMPDNLKRPIPVEVLNEEACIRYSSLSMTGVEVRESPDWLKEKLQVIGVKPVNNVVDVTNFVLHDLGQPLHAFDADIICGGKVLVKTCQANTPFVSLDGVMRKLGANDLMICNAEEPMAIAGIFGGLNSGVSLQTNTIFLESACFQPVSVRKTSKYHSLKTDASFRFERGTDPEMTVFALKRAAIMIKELAGGAISSEVYDFYPKRVERFKVGLAYNNVTRLVGEPIEAETIKSILTALDIAIVSESSEGLGLEVPSYRVDVTREVDVIEEVLRIYGYNRITIPSQVRLSLGFGTKPDRETVQNQVADMLSANGFFEILSNSLTSKDYAGDEVETVELLNPLSNELGIMRQSLLYSGLEAIAHNIKRKNADLKLYEFGRVYSIGKENSYKESQRLGIFMTGLNETHQWNQPESYTTFYNMKAAVDAVIKRLNLNGLVGVDSAGKDFKEGYEYRKGDRALVKFGTVAKKALKLADIEQDVFYAEFDWDLVLRSLKNNRILYRDLSKYPSVRRDLSLLIDESVSFSELRTLAFKLEKKLLKDVRVFDVYKGEKLAAGRKSYALSFVLQDEEKTLTDKQIDSVMNKFISTFEKELGAEIRK